MTKRLLVLHDRYSSEFYLGRGRGYELRPFYTCSDAAMGEEVVGVLLTLGCKVTESWREEEEKNGKKDED